MRIHINNNASGLVAYFTNSLCKDDYFFEEGKSVGGYWHGKLVDEFGLGDRVTKKDFSAFAHNTHPRTGERLSIRETENRRASIEYTFCAPKSISVVLALTGDKEILNAHRLAVKHAMAAVEKDMYTQVKVDGRNTYQRTGNLLYARFDHFTARPTKELDSPDAKYSADMMLHSHCIVPNITKHNGRFRALEGSVVHNVAGYYEAIYHSHLSKSLQDMGYEIERTKDRYEIKAVSRAVVQRFSKRTIEIDQLSRKLGVTDAKKKGELGAKSRLNKSKVKEGVDLKQIWLARLTLRERSAIMEAKGAVRPSSNTITAEQAIDRALEHCLERNSAVPAKKLLGHAMTLGYGALSPEQVRQALKSRSDILSAKKGYLTHLTTKEMVRAEDRMIEFAAKGKNTMKPINPDYQIKRDFLNNQQRKAVRQILSSTDRVTILSGAAGVGKSTLLEEVREGAQQCRMRVVAIAPSSGASRGVLREKGFVEADTVSMFLKNREFQKQAAGQILVVDESSLVGVNTMNSIFQVARKVDARVILSGDVRQHTSPEHGDALRLIHQKAGLKIASVDENLRQRANPEYRKAIDLLAAGKAKEGFAKLEKNGAIIEVADVAARHDRMAEDYVRLTESGCSVLVVSPTHAEGRLVTEAVREKMKERGRISPEERCFTVQRNLSLTEAQKKDVAMYDAAQATTVQFHQNVPGGFKAGQPYDVVSNSADGKVFIAGPDGKKLALPLEAHHHFQVFRKEELRVAAGDIIRITHNGKSLEKSRLHNGDTFQVKGFTKEGHIRLPNGKTLDRQFANFHYGYAQTSHAVQGKDCDVVLIAQSAMSYGASNSKQFYVSASRAKETVRIYTDDKAALKSAVCKSGERLSANDIARGHRERVRRRQFYYKQSIKNNIGHDRTGKSSIKVQRPFLDKA